MKKTRLPAKEQTLSPVYSASRSGLIKANTVAVALRSLDAGDFFSASELFDEMEEKDFHLSAVMQTRVSGVMSMEMTINPADESEEEKQIAETVSKIFWSIPDVYASLSDLLHTGLGYGAALSEIYWAHRNDRVVIDRLAVRDCRWLRFDDLSDPAGLVDFPRWVTRDNPNGVTLDRGRFLFFSPLSGRRHPVRSGLYRGLVWLWLFSGYTVKDWLSFNELYGSPLRVGRYGRNASDEERRAVRDAVQKLGSDAAAVIDDESTIEFIQAQSRGGAPYAETLDFFNREKSKRTLGQTLTTEQGASGSLAQARVHNDVRKDILKADARRLSEAITRDVIRPLVYHNFGPRDIYPHLVIQTSEVADIGESLDNAMKMKELGLEVSELWLRELTGLPAPETKKGDNDE